MKDFDCASCDGDEDADGRMPEGAARLKDRLLAHDAFLIVSPEYNASMPGILENVIFRPQPFTRRYGMLMSRVCATVREPDLVAGGAVLRVPVSGRTAQADDAPL